MKQEWGEAAKAYAMDDFYNGYSTGSIIEDTINNFIAGAEWHNSSLNWVRDLIKAGIEKPEEAVNILKRIDGLLND